MHSWNDVEQLLIGGATEDLKDGDEVRPCLVAFDGDDPLFVAFLRSFDKGAYDDPIIELVALAAPLGADRLAMSFGARAWSLDDPIPPVIPGVGDLRQRALSISAVDGAGPTIHSASALHPFTKTAEGVTWHEPMRHSDAQGWIPSALALAVEHRGELAAPAKEIRRQARRCVHLGHLLALTDTAGDRMQLRGRRRMRR